MRVGVAARAAAPAPTGRLPSDPEAREGELIQRNMDANHAYRSRGVLPAGAVPGAVRCAIVVEDALKALHRKKVYDDPARIQAAVRGAGLPDAYVRRPGRLDTGPGGGWLFAGDTGQACVFGSYGASGYEVEYGTGIADGGCLPAPD
jgi:hypothetical protein